MRIASALCAVAVLWVGGGMSGTVMAQPQSWEVVCDPECKMGQVILAQDQVVSRVLIYVLQGTEIIEVLLPLGISMLAPITVQVDGGPSYDVRIATCRASGCLGVVHNPDAAIATFRAGFDMQLGFTGFDDGGTYFFPYDLRGFTAAYRQYQNGG
jgi:invasion protein IalB